MRPYDAGFSERLKVKDDSVLSLTLLDPTVMSQHISVSKCVFTTIGLFVLDRLLYILSFYTFLTQITHIDFRVRHSSVHLLFKLNCYPIIAVGIHL